MLLNPDFRTQPGRSQRLARLMDLYERNYRRLAELLGGTDAPFDTAASWPANDSVRQGLPLFATVTERSPYTLELRLTYRFQGAEGVELAPDLLVKLYRDARSVEALAASGEPPRGWRAAHPGAAEQAFLDNQWRRNVLLAKWLDYLLDQGYSFVRETTSGVAVP